MTENLIAPASTEGTAPDEPLRVGQTLRLGSLAPSFEPSRHQLYFDLLERAISHEGTRNIALTGAYGTGKSSVLNHLREHSRYGSQIVNLSLSTIGSKNDDNDSGTDSSSTSQTNQIQKEIVKQLLYRTAVSDVPQTRFHRASVPSRSRGLGLAIIVGSGLALVLFALGPLHPLITMWFDGWWRHALAYILLTALIIGSTWLLIRIVHARPLMSASVNAAITTVTLAKKSDSYFDAYLDEIVYFFEATKTALVVIEDIDRFEDAQIFDTLRVLNNLLNESKQLGRRIVFIYAIRDSVFEKIGSTSSRADEGSQLSDHAKEALKRASRTKFFDVIIPVVPFISPDNARDLMTKAMKSPHFKIKPALIRLAARHVADMRMIHNIRNEFEVYRQELVASPNALPDINDNLVFALVLFKNTHLADYESIRHRESSLDRLFVIWRALVSQGLADVTRALSTHRADHRANTRAAEQPTLLRERLLTLKNELDQSVASSLTMTLDSEIEESLATPEGWARVVENDELALTLVRSNGNTTPFTFSASSLERLLGDRIDPSAWSRQDEEAQAVRESALAERLTLLRHSTWEALHSRSDIISDSAKLPLTTEESARLAADVEDVRAVRFADLAHAVLPSELARDLVRHGWLTSHFALYTSNYYGSHLSKEAREYIYRCISTGTPDTTFALSRRDVRQILREQNANKNDSADLFYDPSMLNIDIVDHLLAERPRAASSVARQVADGGESERDFVDAYFGQGKRPGALLAALVPFWRGALHYAATSSLLDEVQRIEILDEGLAVLDRDLQDTSPELTRLIADNYVILTSVARPATRAHADAVLGLIAGSDCTFQALESMNADAREAALALGLFPVTEQNLRVFIPRGRFQLHALRRSNRVLHDHILKHLDEFIVLLKNKPSVFGSVDDEAQLITLVNDIVNLNPKLAPAMLSASPALEVAEITKLPTSVWKPAAAARRVKPTASNIAQYVAQHEVDEDLALLLKARKILDSASIDQAARVELAHAILRASAVIPSTLARVQTVATLSTGVLNATDLTPEPGNLVARLIKARLIADDASAFSSTLMTDWPTLEQTIKVSKQFHTFIAPTVLPAKWVPHFIQSSVPTYKLKRAVVIALPGFLTTASRAEARDIADALAAHGWRLAAARIEALRAAGAFPEQIVSLMAKSADIIDLEDARAIMQALGGDYARVANGGSGRPNFRHTQAYRDVLERFVGTTVRHVREEHFKSLGRRYVARLQ